MEPVQVSCQAPGQTRDLFLMLAITGEFTHKWDAAFSLGRQWLAAIPALPRAWQHKLGWCSATSMGQSFSICQSANAADLQFLRHR